MNFPKETNVLDLWAIEPLEIPMKCIHLIAQMLVKNAFPLKNELVQFTPNNPGSKTLQ